MAKADKKTKTDQQELAKQLLSRRDDVDTIIHENRIVEDVLSGRSAIVCHRAKRTDANDPQSAVNLPFGIAKAPEYAPVTGGPASVTGKESSYLPKHNMESADEYSKRLDMTPFFPEMPSVLQSRLGAMFRKAPDVTFGNKDDAVPDLFTDFLTRATTTNMSLLDVIVKLAEQSQIGGFSGLLVDREVLPDDVQGRDVSQAEVDVRKLGRVIVAPFAAHQIRAWSSDRFGLAWVKLVELHGDYANTWDSKKKEVYTVRVVDRKTISVWDIEKKKDGNYVVSDPVVIEHGCIDGQGKPVVPFRMFNPFPARDGIGRSNLRATAEADVAATRLLSDLLWMLHMMAPILTLTTTREENEIKNIGLGTSYLTVLKGGENGGTDEKLQFVQLEPKAVEKLLEMYEKLCAKAAIAANKNADVGISGPVEQSGISKAWTFKTGEERVLFLLSVCLQEGLQWILELVARMSGLDAEQVSIKFPQSYDISGLSEQTAEAESVIGLFAEYGMPTPIVHILEKLAIAAMGNPSGDELAALKKEIEAVRKRDPRPSAALVAPLNVQEKIIADNAA